MGKHKHILNAELLAAHAKSAELECAFETQLEGLAALRERAAFVRTYWNRGGPTMAKVKKLKLTGQIRDVSMVLYRPKETKVPAPTFVFLHGGGFLLGNEWANDRQMREIAHGWGGVVISMDYPHTPEYIFPSAVEETAYILQRIREQAPILGLEPDSIAFGGTSAGASISFGAAVALDGATWLKAGVAIVGAFDFDTDSVSMARYGDGDLFPSRVQAEPMLANYVPEITQRTDPRVALLRADAKKLPPSFIAAAELDVFRDASLKMANNLREAGRLHTLKIYPGMTHLFFGFSRSVGWSKRCVHDIAKFLREQLPAV